MLTSIKPQTLKRLLDEGLLLLVREQPNGVFERIYGGVIIEASAERAFEVLLDLERFSEFIPQTKRVKVLKRSDSEVLAKFELALKFGVISTKISYVLRHKIDKPQMRISFEYVEGNLRGIEGAWQVVPLSETSCAAFYELSSDLKSLGFMVRKVLSAEPSLETAIQASTVLMVLKAVKERVETRS